MVDNRAIAPGGFNYTGLRDKVAEVQLANKGKTAVLHTPGGPGLEPWDPLLPDTDEEVTVVERSFDREDRQLTLIQKTDIALLVSTDGLTSVFLNQKITVDGQLYYMAVVRRVKTGPVTMMWKVVCRV